MPIDRRFRSTWTISETHRGHSVWVSANKSDGTIHGTIVGVHIESCIGCMKCVEICPVDVFSYWDIHDRQIVDPTQESKCIFCLVCEIVCPTEAIDIESRTGSQDTLDSLLHGV